MTAAGPDDEAGDVADDDGSSSEDHSGHEIEDIDDVFDLFDEDADDDDVADDEAAVSGTGGLPTDDLTVTVAERDAYLADSQRIAAEFANYRRQVEKRTNDQLAQAGGALIERLLPVLDACDGAISHGSADVEPIRAAFFDVLTKEGLELFAPEAGEPFDPNCHEAVGHVAGDDDGGPVVDSMMRAGYAWNGRVLRAAMVTVRG